MHAQWTKSHFKTERKPVQAKPYEYLRPDIVIFHFPQIGTIRVRGQSIESGKTLMIVSHLHSIVFSMGSFKTGPISLK